MDIYKTLEFDQWLSTLDAKAQHQVGQRLDRVEQHHHFGDKKFLGGELFELRWKNGRRVYYAITIMGDGNAALMLLGGNKNGQDYDIAQARTILARQARDFTSGRRHPAPRPVDNPQRP